jgi:hypothetical protein
MRIGVVWVAVLGATLLTSCAKKDSPAAAQPAADANAPSPGGTHAVVKLQNGQKVTGTIVASSPTDMTVAGDDGIIWKIPLAQVKSVDYGGAPARSTTAGAPAPAAGSSPPAPGPSATPAPPPVTTKTYVVDAGSEISVRTNVMIDSATASEGQRFDA